MKTAGLTEFLSDRDFSGVVLARSGTKTVFESASGLATRRWNVPNTLDTRFDSGSIGMLFTSVAVLQQVAAGNIDLETSIHHYVDLDESAIPIGVTLLHLLTHTSGIADDADEEADESYDDLWRQNPVYNFVDTVDLLPLFVDKDPVSEPGFEASENNAGYILAGLALEKVTGRSYRDYVSEEVFGKAGMTSSGFFSKTDATPLVAEGWDQTESGVWVQNLFTGPPIGSPAGGAHVTAADLVTFLGAVRSGTLLNAEFTEEFLIPQVEVDEETSFGFGLEFDLDEEGAVLSFFKDSLAPGTSGILRHYPDENIDLVVLSNSEEGAWDVVTELDDRILD